VCEIGYENNEYVAYEIQRYSTRPSAIMNCAMGSLNNGKRIFLAVGRDENCHIYQLKLDTRKHIRDDISAARNYSGDTLTRSMHGNLVDRLITFFFNFQTVNRKPIFGNGITVMEQKRAMEIYLGIKMKSLDPRAGRVLRTQNLSSMLNPWSLFKLILGKITPLERSHILFQLTLSHSSQSVCYIVFQP